MHNWRYFFTSLATIGGDLFTRHPKSLNRLHKESTDSLSVIITLVTNVNGKETVFNGMTLNCIGKISHVLKNSNGRCVVSSFDRNLDQGSIWTIHRSVLSFILHK